MRIGELAARTGASHRSLRYYEDQGLLTSDRSPSGQRLYTEEHVERVRLVRAFLAAGLSSRTIAEMVPCMARPSAQGAHSALAIMERERDRLRDAMAALAEATSALDALVDVNRRYLEDTPRQPRYSRPVLNAHSAAEPTPTSNAETT